MSRPPNGPIDALPEDLLPVGYISDARERRDNPPAEVMSEFHTQVSFLGGNRVPGTMQLLSNGYARFRSDDGKMVTIIRKEAVELLTQEDRNDSE